MSNPIANPWAALQDKWIAQESSRMDELAALRRKVAAAEGMAEVFESHRCGCQNQELRVALAAWQEANK